MPHSNDNTFTKKALDWKVFSQIQKCVHTWGPASYRPNRFPASQKAKLITIQLFWSLPVPSPLAISIPAQQTLWLSRVDSSSPVRPLFSLAPYTCLFPVLSRYSSREVFPALPPLTSSILSIPFFILYLLMQVGTSGGHSTFLELLFLSLRSTPKGLLFVLRGSEWP